MFFVMWEIFEHKQAVKQLRKLPVDVLMRYEKWKDIVSISGPNGLRLIKGFHDEALSGAWKGSRSSRLGIKYRVIYQVKNNKMFVKVFKITAHDYRRQ